MGKVLDLERLGKYLLVSRKSGLEHDVLFKLDEAIEVYTENSSELFIYGTNDGEEFDLLDDACIFSEGGIDYHYLGKYTSFILSIEEL